MSTITFTSYASGSASAKLPPLHGRAADASFYGSASGALPTLRSSGTPGTVARARLPVLRSRSASTALVVAAGMLPALHSTSAPQGRGSGVLPGLRSRSASSALAVASGALPALAGLAVESEVAPHTSIGAAGLPVLASTATGHSINTGSADGQLPLLRGRAADVAMTWGGGALPLLRGFAFSAGPLDNFLYAEQSAGFVQIKALGAVGRRYASTLKLVDVAAPNWVMVRRELLKLADTPVSLLDGLAVEHETLQFQDVVDVVLRILASEALVFGDSTESFGRTAIQIMETLTLLAGPGSALNAAAAVASAIGMADAAALAWPALISETLDMHGESSDSLVGVQTALEQLQMAAVPVGSASMVALVDENLAMADAAVSQADLVHVIEDGIGVLVTVRLPDTEFIAWVLNAGSNAYTSYSNFPFNSFCELGGRYLGATDTGIYELSGDDDAGAPIDARVRMGLDMFGTSALKRAEAMYLGYRSDGPLVLKVVVSNDGGEREEHWYPLEARPAPEMALGRAKIGRGLKSVYWAFELANKDGADFALDTLKWLPLVLERRMR